MRALEHPWNSRRFNAGQVRVFISGRVLDSVALEFLAFCFRAARRYRSLRPPLSPPFLSSARRDRTVSSTRLHVFHLFSRFFSLSLFRAFRPIQRIKEKRVDRDRTIRPIAAAITKTPERFPRLSLSEILRFFLLSNLFVYVAITSDLAGARTSWSPTRTDRRTDGRTRCTYFRPKFCRLPLSSRGNSTAPRDPNGIATRLTKSSRRRPSNLSANNSDKRLSHVSYVPRGTFAFARSRLL